MFWGMKEHNRIILIDDDQKMNSVLGEALRKENHDVVYFRSAKEALEKIPLAYTDVCESVDLILTDLHMPEIDGIAFLEKSKELWPEIPVILMTTEGSIENAVLATRKGAYHFLVKPFDILQTIVTVDRALLMRKLEKQNQVLRAQHKYAQSYAGMIGKSPSMMQVYDLIERVAQSQANVMIHGESGTGKELVAKAIHQKGPRSQKPFVAINCTAIPETLLESELFGHAKGSFTGAIFQKRGLFEEADGGTLFLDEIGDMPMPLQAKLLRVLQEKKIRAVGDNNEKSVDVRVIAATHQDLKALVKAGKFREDLYYRLSVIPVEIPALRQRTQDIPLLAYAFLEKYNSVNGKHIKTFSKEAMSYLVSLYWEGNVRELENVVERAVVLADKDIIDKCDLPQGLVKSLTTETLMQHFTEDLPSLEDLEKKYINFILEKVGGKKEKAAQILGINRRTLYRKEREPDFMTTSLAAH